MKKLFLLLLAFYLPVYSIYLDNVNDEEVHARLAYARPCQAVGVLISEPIKGTGVILGTATIIHPRVVITAAHVVFETKNTKFYLAFKGKVYEAKGKCHMHPDFTGADMPNISFGEIASDIAIVILDKPIEGVPYPALSRNRPETLVDYVAVGYGGTNAPFEEEEQMAKYACTTIPDYFAEGVIGIPCENIHGAKYFGSTRSGDSGGPLLTWDGSVALIHGITSCVFTMEEKQESLEAADQEDSTPANQPYYSCYASIYGHIDWILDTLEEHL